MGDQVTGGLPIRRESLIEVPNVVHVKVHLLSLNMILISSPQHVLTPYIECGKIWEIRKRVVSEKAKNFS